MRGSGQKSQDCLQIIIVTQALPLHALQHAKSPYQVKQHDLCRDTLIPALLPHLCQTGSCKSATSRLMRMMNMSSKDDGMCLQTFLTPKKWAPKFDWSRFNDIQFTDAESTGITQKEQAFIAKWRKPVCTFTLADSQDSTLCHFARNAVPGLCSRCESIQATSLLGASHMLLLRKSPHGANSQCIHEGENALL